MHPRDADARGRPRQQGDFIGGTTSLLTFTERGLVVAVMTNTAFADVVKGAQAQLDKNDKTPHLSLADAQAKGFDAAAKETAIDSLTSSPCHDPPAIRSDWEHDGHDESP